MDAILGLVLNRLPNSDRNTFSLVSPMWFDSDSKNRTHVYIRNCSSITPKRVIDRFPNLQSLTLKGTNSNSNFRTWLHVLSESVPEIVLLELNLKKMVISDEDLLNISLRFRQFKSLTMNNCSGFSMHGVRSIAANCRKLEVFNIQNVGTLQHGGEWLETFPNTLVALDISCISGMIDIIRLIHVAKRCHNLTSLTLNETVSQPLQLVEILRVSTGLQKLGLLLNRYVKNETTKDECKLLSSELKQCKSISSISLTDCRKAVQKGVCGDFLKAFEPIQDQIRYLDFEGLSAAGHEDQMMFITGCTALQTLRVSSRIGDAGLDGIGNKCTNLVELVVFDQRNLWSITEHGFNSITRGCPDLRSLTIFCSKMTSKSMVEFSRKHPHMRCLKLHMCKDLWEDEFVGEPLNEGFKALVRTCKDMRVLRVPGPLTNNLLRSIVENAKNLEVLQLAATKKDTGEKSYVSGLLQVLKGCKRLRKLSMSGNGFGGVDDDIFEDESTKSLFFRRSSERTGAEMMNVRRSIHNVETDYTRLEEFLFNCHDNVATDAAANYQRVYLKKVVLLE